MSRPCKCRKVAFLPGVTYFKPAGIPLRCLEEVRLSLEEAEALRLKDVERLEQQQGAAMMNISRPTFQRILASARRKTAGALLGGKAIRIEGGNFEIASREACIVTGSEIKQLKEKIMKIAVVTEDGATVSQHFGRAPYYQVITVENGKIVSQEKREKAGHHTFSAGGHQDRPGIPHGFDAGAQSRHAVMAQTIEDCQVLIAGGMGQGAFESLKNRGIEVVVTDVGEIEAAVKLYIQGKLPNLMQRLH